MTATRGPALVGTVEIPTGTLWITIDCLGGDLAVVARPWSRADVVCADDEVRWNLRVEHSATGPASG
ncbi:hypothetical protein O7632_15195 [Solwaraspora sp. WMMD406]|uniref:hypothetical protein n=1 Tax=Solwaraspora sp. WMMD406 TaxID=3016095 RepID=UPI002417672B|nr:hypothetical protein [Solwaraspora sp. WMMD406]MDG4765431.1 hypothetical protein [Solwaraspora sp. WMMD406]